MKNFTLIALLMAAVTFTGCKKDDDEKAAGNIIGRWTTISSLDKEYKNGALVDEDVDTDFGSDNDMEFKSNGTAVDGNGDTYTYKITGSSLTIREDGDDEDEVLEIKKLSSTDMILVENVEQEYNGDKYKYISEITFKKK